LGNLIESTTCKGGTPYTTTYQYSNFGKISSVTQPYEVDGNLTTTKKIMQYDTLGNLLYVQNLMDTPNDTSDDICELYSYNIASLRVEEQCRQRYNGNEAITTYIDYDENGNVTSKIDGNEVETTYEYDELNRMISSSVTVDGVLQTTTHDYDLNGNLIRTKDWRGNTDKYKYDPMNRVYEKTDAKGVAFEKLEYNDKNQQVKSYDAYNRLTTFEYDANGRLVCTTDPEGDTQTQEYDNIGNVRAKYDGRGYETSYTYDMLGRLTEVYNEGILKSSYSYYIDGTLKEQDLGGFVTTYYYTPSGNLKKVCDPNGIGEASKTETYEYTPTGLLKEKTDRNGNTTTYTYDCHGRLKQQITEGNNKSITITISPSETDIGYDGNGNIKRITVGEQEKRSGTIHHNNRKNL
jgi:YD repeat-containing protein